MAPPLGGADPTPRFGTFLGSFSLVFLNFGTPKMYQNGPVHDVGFPLGTLHKGGCDILNIILLRGPIYVAIRI